MKYIKTFENTHYYKPGDYVLMSGKYLVSEKDTPIKLTNKYEWGDFEFMFNDGSKSAIERKLILRYLTPEEIEDFETKLNSKKYNL